MTIQQIDMTLSKKFYSYNEIFTQAKHSWIPNWEVKTNDWGRCLAVEGKEYENVIE